MEKATPAPNPTAAQGEAPAAAGAPRATPVPELSDRDFIPNPVPQPVAPLAATPAPVQLPAPTPRIAQLTVAQLPTLNELSIEPVKKSRVRIRRNDFAAAPVFEDFLYPDVGPLKIKGAKFYVEVLGDGAVNIRKNGQPFAYQAPGVVVQ